MATATVDRKTIQRTVPERSITVRRPDLDFAGDALPKYFVADDIVRSHIAAMLSAVFPEGEDFFVQSVRNYRDKVTDPVLKQQVKGFIGQEALHGREHRAINQRLAEHGFPTLFVDRLTRNGLAFLAKVAPKRDQLAVTAGLEHYTATLAETLLRHEDALDEFATDEVRTLFAWHALEESEHKSVAFDVFQHTVGNQRVRVAVMYACHVGFLAAMTAATSLSIALDGNARRHPLKVLKSLRGLRSHPFFTRNVVKRLRDYDRRDFHPDDHNTDDLLEIWRDVLGAVPAA